MTNTLSTSKFVAALIGVAMVFSFVFALPAKASTTDDLAAQIQSLLATIAGLQAQLASMQGGGTTGATSGGACGVTFTQNHSKGDRGGQVMDIQKFLNGDSATQVATTGAGSAGNESSYFGSLTKAAVSKFQTKYATDILAPVGLTAPTGFWGPSSIAKANMMTASATCAGTGTGTGTGATTPTGTGVTVSAAAQPGNSLAVKGAARVPFTRFTLTNNSGAAVTVDSVTVERAGLANDNNFAGVVLLDENGVQMGISRLLNSNHQAKVGERVTLAAGASKTFTVAANMEAAAAASGTARGIHAGEVAAFSVVAVNTTATVAGTLPITGAQHTMNASLAIGQVDGDTGATDPGAIADKEVGTTGYTFTSIKLSASNEDARLNSIRFNQSGSAGASDLANVVVEIDGTSYPTTVSADGKYYVVSFGSGIVIKKGQYKEVIVKGDIVGGPLRDVAFDIYKFTDINVTGETYGYGITVTDGGAGFTTTSPVYDANVVSITAGSFSSVSKSNEAPAANIAIQKSDEILGAFEVEIKGEPITIQTLRVRFDIATTTGGGTPNGSDITNVTLVDGNGNTLAGPLDGEDGDLTATAAEGSVSFSAVNLPVGKTVLFVKGQIGTAFSTGNTITVMTQPDATSDDWASAIGDNTGNTVTLPTNNATANVMTIKGAEVTITVSPTPAAQNVVKGVKDFVFARVQFNATASGEDVRFSAAQFNVETDTGSSYPNNCFAYDGATKLNSSSVAPTTDAAQTFTFDNQKLIVTKGTSDKVVEIKCDVPASSTTNDTIEWKVTAAATISGTGVDSGQAATVTHANSSDNQNKMTLKAGGTLVTSKDSASPAYTMAVAGTADVTLGILKFTGTNEAMTLKQVALQLETASSTASDLATVELWDGATSVATGFFAGGATTTLLTLTEDVEIPADGYKTLTIKGDLASVGTGQAGSQGAFIRVNHDTDDQAGTTQALGKASSTTISDSSAADTAVAGVRMFRGVPTVAVLSVPSTALIAGDMDLFRFSVSAPTGGNGIGLDKITLNVATSSVNAVSGSVFVTAVKVYAYTDAGFTTPVSSHSNGLLATVGVPTAGDNDVSFGTSELNIPAGQTYYIKTVGTIAKTAGTGTYASSVTTKLGGDSAGFNSLLTKVDTVTNVDTQTADNFIWSGHATTDSESTDADWYNGYGVTGLPSDYTTAVTIQ